MARKLKRNGYATDPDGGDTVLLRAGTVPPARFVDQLGAHMFEDDDSDDVPLDAPAPPGGVTGEDPNAGDDIDGDALIVGNVDDVEERVGDDPAKAAAALAAERKAAKPRTSLVEKLERIAGTS